MAQQLYSTCVFLSPNSPTTRCAAAICVSVGLRCRRRRRLFDVFVDAGELFFCVYRYQRQHQATLPLHLYYALEVKREYYQNCSVLGCVTQCSQSAAHSCERFKIYRSSRLGLSHWDRYAMHRGGCLELYYCNMVEWSWWDSSLI